MWIDQLLKLNFDFNVAAQFWFSVDYLIFCWWYFWSLEFQKIVKTSPRTEGVVCKYIDFFNQLPNTRQNIQFIMLYKDISPHIGKAGTWK